MPMILGTATIYVVIVECGTMPSSEFGPSVVIGYGGCEVGIKENC